MISYKELKERISIIQVLEKYGVKTNQKGKQLVSSCPSCGGTFKVSKEKNCFKCFSPGCTAKGNILDLVSILEAVPLKKAAERLYETFLAPKEQPTLLERCKGMLNAKRLSLFRRR